MAEKMIVRRLGLGRGAVMSTAVSMIGIAVSKIGIAVSTIGTTVGGITRRIGTAVKTLGSPFNMVNMREVAAVVGSIDMVPEEVRSIHTVTAEVGIVNNRLGLVSGSAMTADMRKSTGAAGIASTVAIVAVKETENIHSV